MRPQSPQKMVSDNMTVEKGVTVETGVTGVTVEMCRWCEKGDRCDSGDVETV